MVLLLFVIIVKYEYKSNSNKLVVDINQVLDLSVKNLKNMVFLRFSTYLSNEL